LIHGGFPLPDVDWEPTREYFAGTACVACGGTSQTWTTVSGRGTLFSWSVVHFPWIPQFKSLVPFVTALVALDEDPGVRLVTRMIDCAIDHLRCDLPVCAVFRPLRFDGLDGEVVVPMFQPTKS